MTSEKSATKTAGAIVDSTVEFGAAATKFCMEQVETAMCAVSSPLRAMDRFRRSIDHFTNAMKAPLEGEAAEAVDGSAENGTTTVSVFDSKFGPHTGFSGRKM